jgi:hypothetical protein
VLMNRRTHWTTLATLALLSMSHSDSRGGNPPTPCTSLVHFAQSSYSVTEEQGLVTLTVVRETCLNQEVTVQYQCTNGSAVSDQDYTAVSGTLTFPVNVEYRYIQVPIINDSASESSELFTVTLSNPTNASLTTPGTATVSITDGVPTASLSVNPSSSTEGNQSTVTFTVNLNSPAPGPVTVPYTIGGTATRYGANFISNPSLEVSGDRWWLNSENNKGTLTRTNEDSFFGGYCAKFQADTMDGWMIPTYILHPDLPPGGLSTTQQYALSFYAKTADVRTLWLYISNSNSQHIMANFGNVTFTPTWKRYTYVFTPAHSGLPPTYYPNIRFAAYPDDLPLTLYVDGLKLEQASAATKFGDYSTSSSTDSLTIATGQTSGQFSATVINDKIYEDDESISVTMGTPTGAEKGSQYTASSTIIEDESKPLASLQGLPTTAPESEDGEPSWVGVGISLNHGNTEKSIQVPLSYGGTASLNVDYTAPAQAVLPAGTQFTTINAVTIDDTLDEPDETINITVGSSNTVSPGSPSTGTITLQDDFDPPEISLSVATSTFYEDVGEVELLAELSSTHNQTVTVNYATSDLTAIAGEDYTASSGVLEFAPEETSKLFSVPISRDCSREDDESFLVELTAPANGVLSATSSEILTIKNPDVVLEVIPNGSWSPFLVVDSKLNCSVPTQIQIQYRDVTNPSSPGNWTDCQFTETANPWTEASGCFNRGLTWNLQGLGGIDLIEVRTIVTVDEESAFVTGTCGPLGGQPLEVAALRFPRGAVNLTCPETTHEPDPGTAATGPTFETDGLSGEYFRAKYFSVGSAYQLSPGDLQSNLTSSFDPPQPIAQLDDENVPTMAAALVSQAVYGDGNGLWNTNKTIDFTNRNVRMLGGSIATEWRLRDVGIGVSEPNDKVALGDVEGFEATGSKYILATQTLATIVRGGTIYDTFRVVSRHSVGAAAVESSVRRFIHTLQGAEVHIYSTRPEFGNSGDARNLPLEPPSSPEMIAARPGMGYHVSMNLDNKRVVGEGVETEISEVAQDGGYIRRAVGMESTISSDGRSDSAFDVNEAVGFMLQNTFGLPGIESDPTDSTIAYPKEQANFSLKYETATGVKLEYPHPDSYLGTVSNALLIRAQNTSRSNDALGPDQREGSLAIIGTDLANPELEWFIEFMPPPESVASIVTADGSVLGDSKSDLGAYSTDWAFVGGPLTLGAASALPTMDPALAKADRIGLLAYDPANNTLRLSVERETDGGITWARLSLDPPVTDGPTAAPEKPRGRLTVEERSRVGNAITITASLDLEGLSNNATVNVARIRWRTPPYGKARIGGRPWRDVDSYTVSSATQSGARARFELTGVTIILDNAADGTEIKAEQLLELMCFTSVPTAITASDTLRVGATP